jgi:3-phenylpropionate/cinnamic acid dioxygenase small subunit
VLRGRLDRPRRLTSVWHYGPVDSRGRIGDKLEIVELLYRYAELIDAGDFDGVGQLMSRSTFGGPASGSVSGAENIAKLFAMTTRRYPDHGNTPRTRHLVLNPIVELADDATATTRSTFCVLQDTETVPIQPIVVGRYYDTFGRDEGGWYFTERKVEIQMTGDVSAHLMVDPKAFER